MSDEANEQPKEDTTPGIFSWNELMSPDAEGSAKFYESMFGWTREKMPMPGGFDYHFFRCGERPVAGMIQLTPEMQMGECPPFWGSYVTVENADESVAKAKELGAEVLKEVTDLPMGRFAVLKDPQGAVISIWEFGEGKC